MLITLLWCRYPAVLDSCVWLATVPKDSATFPCPTINDTRSYNELPTAIAPFKAFRLRWQSWSHTFAAGVYKGTCTRSLNLRVPRGHPRVLFSYSRMPLCYFSKQDTPQRHKRPSELSLPKVEILALGAGKRGEEEDPSAWGGSLNGFRLYPDGDSGSTIEVPGCHICLLLRKRIVERFYGVEPCDCVRYDTSSFYSRRPLLILRLIRREF
jgi:hypothetical protein